MNKNKKLETERLLLLPSINSRDNVPFMEMLRVDGDFHSFTGLEPTEDNINAFDGYLESGCLYSVFAKNNPEKFIGYAGVCYQNRKQEVGFYISKPYRNQGYCTEALQKICEEIFVGNIKWFSPRGIHEILDVDVLYATTLTKNDHAKRVLEKCCFKRNDEVAMEFKIFIDSESGALYNNQVVEYLRKK